MLVTRLGEQLRSVQYLPFIEPVVSLEDLALRHLNKSLEPSVPGPVMATKVSSHPDYFGRGFSN